VPFQNSPGQTTCLILESVIMTSIHNVFRSLLGAVLLLSACTPAIAPTQPTTAQPALLPTAVESVTHTAGTVEPASNPHLDADFMQKAIEAGKYTRLVQKAIQRSYDLGINGVPTYILNDRYAIVGAQLYSVFQQALEKPDVEKR
jgi:hypothetical protein